MTHRIWQRAAVLVVVLVAAGAFAATGCEDTPEDALQRGKQALANQQLEQAHQHFEEALEADAQHVRLEARRLMATTYIERGGEQQFERAEQILEQLWEHQGFDRETDLNAHQRHIRQLMNEQFSELYEQWARSIDEHDEPQRFEQVVVAGLDRNSRDGTLNSMLVDFYRQRADRFEEEGDRIRAAQMHENIQELYQFPDTHRQSRREAQRLRREAFDDEALDRFEQHEQADLIEQGYYDPDTQALSFTLEQPLDRRLDPDDQQALEQARNTAVETLQTTLLQLVVPVAGMEAGDTDNDALAYALQRQDPVLTAHEEDFHEPGSYSLVVSLERDELFDIAFDYAEYHRTDPADAPSRDTNGEGIVIGEDIQLDTSPLDDPQQ